MKSRVFTGDTSDKELHTNAGARRDTGPTPAGWGWGGGVGKSPWKCMAIHSSIFVWLAKAKVPALAAAEMPRLAKAEGPALAEAQGLGVALAEISAVAEAKDR